MNKKLAEVSPQLTYNKEILIYLFIKLSFKMCFEVNLRIDVLKNFHNVQGWLGGNLIITSERLPPGINWEKIILVGFL